MFDRSVSFSSPEPSSGAALQYANRSSTAKKAAVARAAAHREGSCVDRHASLVAGDAAVIHRETAATVDRNRVCIFSKCSRKPPGSEKQKRRTPRRKRSHPSRFKKRFHKILFHIFNVRRTIILCSPHPSAVGKTVRN
jgi:hypothetical protein